ncbi:MAG: sulfurtransferase [Anaerolineales bacterium]|nr:sulfurtransferase [Anaerolineales bacterium]
MVYTTIISAKELYTNLQDPEWAVIDCRFNLGDIDKGRREYLKGHIPGAVYAHLNEDLSGEIIPGKTGRHPLPTIEKAIEKFSTLGIDEHSQVVAYDDYPINGASAARLWWLLRWIGHEAVAVLNGGWKHWLSSGFPQRDGEEQRAKRQFSANPDWSMQMDVMQVEKIRLDDHYRLFDSRSADRYRGENETIDPIAGHIPGAYSAPFMDNYDQEGLLLPPEQIRQRFTRILNSVPIEKAVFYCGSGVTGSVNVFAAAYAGMDGAKLYPGSWSEWIIDPLRPIATK